MVVHLWAWFCAQVWPNLLASILWAAPTFAWHHRRIKRHITAEVERATTGGTP